MYGVVFSSWTVTAIPAAFSCWVISCSDASQSEKPLIVLIVNERRFPLLSW